MFIAYIVGHVWFLAHSVEFSNRNVYLSYDAFLQIYIFDYVFHDLLCIE